jgi:hypothetical protein
VLPGSINVLEMAVRRDHIDPWQGQQASGRRERA